MLIVAGRFDEPKALELIEKYFGALPKPKRKLDKTYTEEPPQDGERSVTLRRVGELGLVGLCYHVPAGGHPDNAVLDVLANCPFTPIPIFVSPVWSSPIVCCPRALLAITWATTAWRIRFRCCELKKSFIATMPFGRSPWWGDLRRKTACSGN